MNDQMQEPRAVPRPPIPVIFEPLLKPKPWGGRKLAELFGKPLPPDVPIGESWELADLPDNESRVGRGPLAGATASELIRACGRELTGDVPLADGRFPLLIKFLDARESLSVQVHPKPDIPAVVRGELPLKHEAWYVIDADPGAQIFIGFKPSVTAGDVAKCAGKPEFTDLLQTWQAEAGRCFYLPSGTVHALGAGVVVAEVQTPSDVTYRFFDWNRVGLDGKPRELHIDEAIRNARYDVSADEILQRDPIPAAGSRDVTRVAACEAFTIDRVDLAIGERAVPAGEMRVWILLSGAGRLRWERSELPLAAGDVALLPAAGPDRRVETTKDCRLLEVRVPSPRG